MQWRTFGFDVIVRGGGIDKEAESIENDQELIKPLKLGGQAAAAESCQSRGWSRIRTSCDDGRNDCAKHVEMLANNIANSYKGST